jgi:RNA polymerase sigma factor (sigma-70 family)
VNRNDMDKLISSNYINMKRIAVKMTLGTHEAEDLLQETCIKLMMKHSYYDEMHDSTFLAFAKVVMLRIYLNIIRKLKRYTEIKDFYDYYRHVTSFDLSIDDFNLLYESLIKYLKSDYEVQVVNMLIEGYRFQEISEHLNITKNTVHSRHRNLRLRLKEEMI